MNKILAIKNFVKAETGVTRKEMNDRSRRRDISFARHMAMYLCRRYTTASFPEIGASFSKDHSSVIHAVNRIQKLIDNQDVRCVLFVGKFINECSLYLKSAA